MTTNANREEGRLPRPHDGRRRESVREMEEGRVYKDYLIVFSSSSIRAKPLRHCGPPRLREIRRQREWKVVERTMPSGMTAEALALCTPVTSYLADLVYEGKPSASRDLSKAVYLWIPYH